MGSRLLEALKEEADEIERTDSSGYEIFINIAVRMEEDPDRKLTGREFEFLNKLHQRFVLGWNV